MLCVKRTYLKLKLLLLSVKTQHEFKFFVLTFENFVSYSVYSSCLSDYLNCNLYRYVWYLALDNWWLHFFFSPVNSNWTASCRRFKSLFFHFYMRFGTFGKLDCNFCDSCTKRVQKSLLLTGKKNKLV